MCRTTSMPSGIRLQQLIQNRYKEILAREKNNDKFIHLYDIGAYWVAFERSACRLSGLFPKRMFFQTGAKIVKFRFIVNKKRKL